MTDGALRLDRYSVDGRGEPLLRCGPQDGLQVLLIPPLFGEMNRTRRLLADTMRNLAARGLGSALPDLPGTGESATALEDVSWDSWQNAVRAVAEQLGDGPVLIASVRGGALLDEVAAAGWWRLAPANGASLLRDLLRGRQMADAEEGAKPALSDLQERLAQETMELAGYRVSPALSSGLASAQPCTHERVRLVQLADQTDAAAGTLQGTPLWRRAEPGASPDLAAAMAEDIASWARTCAAA